MFCKYCGNELTEEARFCNKCGKIIDNESTQEEKTDKEFDFFSDANEPVQTSSKDFHNAQEDKAKEKAGEEILKFSILGLAFGSTFFLSFLGIIFSYIARGKIKRYKRKYGETNGRASVGKGLNIGGMILSWISMAYIVFYIIYIIVVVVMLVNGTDVPASTYPYLY